MAVKKSKRTQANSKGRIVKHSKISKRVKIEVIRKKNEDE